jgi:hypothetical protein
MKSEIAFKNIIVLTQFFLSSIWLSFRIVFLVTTHYWSKEAINIEVKNLKFSLFPSTLSGIGATYFSSSSSSYPYPTKWGRYNMFSCSDKDSAFIFTTGCLRLPDVNDVVLTTANAVGTNSLTCLPKHGGAWDNKFWSPMQWLTTTIIA